MKRSQSVLLCVALALALCSRSAVAKRRVDPSIYANPQTCLDAMWSAANTRLSSTPLIANCLRMCFHDAGTYKADTDDGGADGSIQFTPEQGIAANAGLGACIAVMPQILADVRAVAGCERATYADVLQVSCACGTFVIGGKAVDMIIGRPDATGPDGAANDRLPGPCTGAAGVVNFWQDRGITSFPAAKMALLMNAAHGIGAVRANSGSCLLGGGPGVEIRTAGPAWDGSYFNKLFTAGAHFVSDRVLVDDGQPTQAMAQDYANNHAQFQEDWGTAFFEMSLLGCDHTGLTPLRPTTLPPVRVNVGGAASPPPSPPPASPPPVVVDPSPPPVVASPPPIVVDPSPPPVVASPPPVVASPPPVIVDPAPPPVVTYPPPGGAPPIPIDPAPPTFLPGPAPPPTPAPSPPPKRGPVCGRRGRWPYYCPANPAYKCCANKTCCPTTRACCGTLCCQRGQKCCSKRVYWWAARRWVYSLSCKKKC